MRLVLIVLSHCLLVIVCRGERSMKKIMSLNYWVDLCMKRPRMEGTGDPGWSYKRPRRSSNDKYLGHR